MQHIIDIVSNFVISTISDWEYLGIFLMMAIESANIPLPSEIIMTFAGYFVALGKINFHLTVLVGALGNLFGSLLSYYLGYFLGRPGIKKYGKYILIREEDFERSKKWFSRFGTAAVFITRMLPVVRTFISFPAGVLKMNVFIFSILTFIGSLIWSYVLVYLGYVLGQNWYLIEKYFRRFDLIILGIIAIMIIYVVIKLIKRTRRARA